MGYLQPRERSKRGGTPVTFLEDISLRDIRLQRASHGVRTLLVKIKRDRILLTAEAAARTAVVVQIEWLVGDWDTLQ